MKQILTASVVLCMTACAPVLVAVPLVASAPEIDRQLNHKVFGGNEDKTISGDAARAAHAGDENAKSMCGLYEFVSLVDVFYFSRDELNCLHKQGYTSHCERWRVKEDGKLNDIMKGCE